MARTQGFDGFSLTYEHPVAAQLGKIRNDIQVTVRLIWPEDATEEEIGKALATATAHALEQYGKRVGG